MMLRRITVEHRTPKIATAAGVADLARPKKTQLLAAIATLTLATTTACSTDNPNNSPKINPPAPKTAAALPGTPQQASIAPAPPISEAEAASTSKSYFDLSKKARAERDVKTLGSIESGILLEISTARLERILKYGDNIGNDEDLAANSDIKAISPQGAPAGSDRWLLSTGRQTIGKQSRGSLGVLRQTQGVGPWKMSFLAFTNVGQDFPAISQIATTDSSTSADPAKIYYGEDICRDFASYIDGGPTQTSWGPRAKAVIQSAQKDKQDAGSLTNGGTISVKTEVREDDRVPAWSTSDGGKLVMCTTKTTSSLSSGSSTPITITKSQSFQNLNGRTTRWKSLDLVNVGMTVFKIPPSATQAVDIIADSVRSLSADGTPA
ncbi:hypothetical protein ABIA38_002936 [Embleya sp. AB8]